MSRSALLVAALLFVACEDGDSAPDGGTPMADAGSLPLADLEDPETCKDCHPRHYREWASSMHAYAADDPVFLAMNARGQRETDGALGDFCVNCHAPMAVRAGYTEDGLNLDEVPDAYKGVTCYFCHNVVDVEGEHNNPLVLANDTIMRGGILDPVRPSAHGVEYSPLHDGFVRESSKLCGSCHDIVTPAGVHLERTFAEWKNSVFGAETFAEGALPCNGCHMTGRNGVVVANDPDSIVGPRTIHEHLWPGIDVALTPFPDMEVQRKAIEMFMSNIVTPTLIVEPNAITVILETQSGHGAPSGATQDRRLWIELTAYDANDNLIFTTGEVADDEIVDKPEGTPGYDSDLLIFRDYLYDEDGNEVHMFWEAAPSEAHPEGYESRQVPPTVERGVPHTTPPRTYALTVQPERVLLRVRVRPMGLDVLDDVIASGDLDPAIRDAMPTFTPNDGVIEWRRAEHDFGVELRTPKNDPLDPCEHLLLLDPDEPTCR